MADQLSPRVHTPTNTRLALLLAATAIAASLFWILSGSSPASAQVANSGVACNASGGSGGFAPGEYSTTIAGRPALLYVGTGYDASRPTMLTYFLHGDGANTQGFLTSTQRTLFDDNGWIYVAPRANGDVWYSTGVGGDESGIEANAQLLEDVYESIYSDYNVCRNVLLGSSASGGSWFYDAYFLATRGDRYPAYMNLGCGSSGINSAWAGFSWYSNLLTFNTDADILARTKLHYSIGTADFLYPGAQQAIPHLQSLGFDVTADIRDGVAHCAFDTTGTAVNWWTSLCTSGFIPAASYDAAGIGRPESCNPGEAAGPQCLGRPVTVNLALNQSPTVGDDVILGTPGRDVINGLAGNDTICAGGGDDVIDGGPGADTILGEAGRDRMLGGDGDDIMDGGDDVDRMWGGAGADDLKGGGGSDRIYGGNDADVISGGPGADRLYGNDGNDVIAGLGGQDRILGGAGNDVLQGNHNSDQLFGGPGDDILRGAKGRDKLYGEDGNDELYGGDNTDYLVGGPGADLAHGQRGRDNPYVPGVSGCQAESRISC